MRKYKVLDVRELEDRDWKGSFNIVMKGDYISIKQDEFGYFVLRIE